MRNSAEFSCTKAPKNTHYNVNYCLHRVGVVEAASSSLVTQTKIRRNCTNSYGFFFLFLLMFNIFLSFSFLIRLKVHTKYIQPRYVHVFGKVCTNSTRKTSKSLINQGFSALASTFCSGRGLNLRPLLIFAMIQFIRY